jgi:hypothetical protein
MFSWKIKLLVVSLEGLVANTNWLAVNRQSWSNCDSDSNPSETERPSFRKVSAETEMWSQEQWKQTWQPCGDCPCLLSVSYTVTLRVNDRRNLNSCAWGDVFDRQECKHQLRIPNKIFLSHSRETYIVPRREQTFWVSYNFHSFSCTVGYVHVLL